MCTGLQPCLLLEANSNGGMSSRVTSPVYPIIFEYGASQLVQTADTQESPTLILEGSCLFAVVKHTSQAQATAEAVSNTAKKLDAAEEALKPVETVNVAV